MNKPLIICAVFLVILWVSPVLADDLQKGLDAYDKEDYETALSHLKPLAEQGVAEAQYRVGNIYGNGLGVTQDWSEYFDWMKASAEQGHAEAQVSLGHSYKISNLDEEAVKWWRRAAENENAEAQRWLGYTNGTKL